MRLIVICLLAVTALLVLERTLRYPVTNSYYAGAGDEITVATTAIHVSGNPQENISKIGDMVALIKEEHRDVDLIVFGEAISGLYKTEDNDYHRHVADTVPGNITESLSAICIQNAVYISAGMVERFNGRIYNSQVMISDSGQIITIQRKKYPKASSFEPGYSTLSVSKVRGLKTGTTICYDISKKETVKKARDESISILIHSNADYYEEFDSIGFAYRYLAKQYRSWLVTSNRVGTEGNTRWDGHIEIIDPFGRVVKNGKEVEQYIVFDIKCNTDINFLTRPMYNFYNKISLIVFTVKHFDIARRYYDF